MSTSQSGGRHALRSPRSRRPLVAFAAVTVAGATILGTGVVNAAINSPNAPGAPGAPGEVHGCVADDGGAVRIIGANAECGDDERFITWNKSGRPGAKGAQGIQGIQGLTGLTGAAGEDGEDGVTATNVNGRTALDPDLDNDGNTESAFLVTPGVESVPFLTLTGLEAGVYEISADVRTIMNMTAAGDAAAMNCWIIGQFAVVPTLGGLDVQPGSERILQYATGDVSAPALQVTSSLQEIITVPEGGGDVVLQVLLAGADGCDSLDPSADPDDDAAARDAYVYSDLNGRSAMNYVLLEPAL